MRDPRRQGARLAGPGPGEHQDRSFQRVHRLPLRGVQPVEIRRGPRRHRAGGKRSALEGIGFVETAHARQSRRIAIRIKDEFTLCSRQPAGLSRGA